MGLILSIDSVLVLAVRMHHCRHKNLVNARTHDKPRRCALLHCRSCRF